MFRRENKDNAFGATFTMDGYKKIEFRVFGFEMETERKRERDSESVKCMVFFWNVSVCFYGGLFFLGI